MPGRVPAAPPEAPPVYAMPDPHPIGVLPFSNEPEDTEWRVPSRVWGAIAVIALLLAIAAGGGAVVLWRQNTDLSRQVSAVEGLLSDVTADVDGLTSDAEAQGGTADDLAARLAALEETTAQLAQLDGLGQRLDAVESTALDLANQIAAIPADDTSALQAEIGALRSQLSSLELQVRSLCEFTEGWRDAAC